MKIPNADKAIIGEDKLREYLLNVRHQRGGPKARLLVSRGYRPDQWQRLEQDIRAQHLTAEVAVTTASDYGTRFEIVAPLVGPLDRAVPFRSIWQIDTGTHRPRLLTIYPR